MQDIIQLLPEHVANQIAAGEVVQRPCSVIKELMENAVDAKATSITLIVKDAGKKLIQVVDNGVGMNETDARMALERHATSKIKKTEDLFDIHTKGFRGEALASIAAVAHLELKTKPHDEELGTAIINEGNEVSSQEPVAINPGTSILVKNLFYNVPARRNFLKSKNVEQRHNIDEFQRVALAHPQIEFKMIHDQGELFYLPAGKMRQRIVGIMGRKIDKHLVPIQENTDILKVNGYITKPEYAKKKRGNQYFFANHRFIKSPYLHHAVQKAYEGLLPEKAIPAYFLDLSMDAKSIDINIHPTKTEIQFENEHAIYAIINSAVKHSLGQYQVKPVLDFEKRSELDTSYRQHHKAVKPPRIDVDKDFNPFRQQEDRGIDKRSPFSSSEAQTGQPGHFELDGEKFMSKDEELTLFNDQLDDENENIFQFDNQFLVLPQKDKIFIIDQHRAHYRIRYEEILKNITIESASSQQMLFPLQLDFSEREMQLLAEHYTVLESIGFQFQQDKKQLKIHGIPSEFQHEQLDRFFDEIISELDQNLPEQPFEKNDHIARTLAKPMAVKNGNSLQNEEAVQLVHDLFKCKEPIRTPDGRRVMLELTAEGIKNKLL
jgi:DNA mismatch repair protein MutL